MPGARTGAGECVERGVVVGGNAHGAPGRGGLGARLHTGLDGAANPVERCRGCTRHALCPGPGHTEGPDLGVEVDVRLILEVLAVLDVTPIAAADHLGQHLHVPGGGGHFGACALDQGAGVVADLIGRQGGPQGQTLGSGTGAGHDDHQGRGGGAHIHTAAASDLGLATDLGRNDVAHEVDGDRAANGAGLRRGSADSEVDQGRLGVGQYADLVARRADGGSVDGGMYMPGVAGIRVDRDAPRRVARAAADEVVRNGRADSDLAPTTGERDAVDLGPVVRGDGHRPGRRDGRAVGDVGAHVVLEPIERDRSAGAELLRTCTGDGHVDDLCLVGRRQVQPAGADPERRDIHPRIGRRETGDNRDGAAGTGQRGPVRVGPDLAVDPGGRDGGADRTALGPGDGARDHHHAGRIARADAKVARGGKGGTADGPRLHLALHEVDGDGAADRDLFAGSAADDDACEHGARLCDHVELAARIKCGPIDLGDERALDQVDP